MYTNIILAQFNIPRTRTGLALQYPNLQQFAARSQHVAALLQHAIARQSGDYLKISINMHNISKDLNDYQVLTSNSQ